MNLIDFGYVLEALVFLTGYIPMTLGLAVGSMLLASLLGIAVMFVRWQKIPVLNELGTLYVIIGRAVPTLIILYVVFFAFPVLLMYLNGGRIPLEFNSIPPLVFALVGLTLHSGAYLAEIFRTAVGSVPNGQFEAALSCGMTTQQVFRRVIIPQAAVLAMPLMTNQFLGLIKSTSIAFMITVMEMFGAANYLSSISERYIEIYFALAILYWLSCIIFEKILRQIEKRLAYYKGVQA